MCVGCHCLLPLAISVTGGYSTTTMSSNARRHTVNGGPNWDHCLCMSSCIVLTSDLKKNTFKKKHDLPTSLLWFELGVPVLCLAPTRELVKA